MWIEFPRKFVDVFDIIVTQRGCCDFFAQLIQAEGYENGAEDPRQARPHRAHWDCLQELSMVSDRKGPCFQASTKEENTYLIYADDAYAITRFAKVDQVILENDID